MNKTEQLIRRYLKDVRIMQVATAKDNQPWVCNLHVIADDDTNLYWLSTPDRRHSMDIQTNPHVSAAVGIKLDHPLVGLQVEGDAEVVTDPNVMRNMLKRYQDYHQSEASWIDAIVAGTDKHKLYRLKPRLWMAFDQVNSEGDPRQVWQP